MRSALLLGLGALLLGCAQAGEAPSGADIAAGDGQVSSSMPVPPGGEMSQVEQIECNRKGGRVERRGRAGMQMCVMPYLDGGKLCTDSSQCEARCIVEGNPEPGSADEDVVGICQRDDRLFGCFGEVTDGRITQAMCID